VTPEEAQQLYEVREALEGLACRLFTERATKKQVQALSEALVRLSEAFATEDKRTIIAETTSFYVVLLDGCGNDIIGSMIQSLQARVLFLRATSMSQPGQSARQPARDEIPSWPRSSRATLLQQRPLQSRMCATRAMLRWTFSVGMWRGA
jgi:DNA-binding GntR family transcriptional regulator